MRRFFSLLLILSLVNPTSGAWADELRPIQEGSQQTGLEQRMFQAGTEEGILVYLDPKVKDGRLVRPGKPFRVAREMNRWLWDKPEVKAAKVVALSNMRTTRRKKSGKAQFSLSGPKYGTTLNYDADSPPRLLVLADSKTQLPIAAYSIPGGKLVYSVSEQIQVFLDGTVKDGRLTGSPRPYRLLQMVPAALWKEKAVQDAKVMILANVPTGKRDDILSFHVGGQGYPTTLDYVPGETPPRLLVVMDPKARTPSAAYEMKTGEQVFPGSNQMRVYLDPKIERGKLAGNPAPLLITGKATASFWENKEFQGASNLVFADVPTRKSANKENQKNMAVFSVKGKGYTITKAFDPQHPPRLLVVVDLKSQEPTAAYDMETGEQLFSTAERIPVYLNPRIKAGRLVGEPEPFVLMTRNLVGLLEKGEVKRAATVALGNIPTKRSTVGKSETSAAFGLTGETYVIDRQFDPDQDLRLLVVVDPSTGFPIEAYDFSTGERVFSAKDLIHVYINPSVRNGRLADDARPFRIARTVSGKVWNQREIREAETVALSNVSTIHVAGTAIFFVDTRGYPTRRKYDAEHPFHVLVIVNPVTRVPTVAYDLSTGEEVFSAGDLVQIYLDPRIEEGRFSNGEKPFQLLQIPRLTATFWSKPEVKQATTLALANVQASNLRGTAGFYLGNTGYRTTRRFDVDHPLRLIIHEQIDPWLPIAAYDMATGEQIYPVTEAPADPRLGALADLADEDKPAQAGVEERRIVEIYLDPIIENGRLKGNPTPVKVTAKLEAAFWEESSVRQAKVVALANLTITDRNGRVGILFNRKYYRTSMRFKPGRKVSALLLVDPKTRVPLSAYDMTTGKQILLSKSYIKVYLDPKVKDGHLVGGAEPVLVVRKLTSKFWDSLGRRPAKTIALENVPSRIKRKKFGITIQFELRGKDYPVKLARNPERPPRLLVIVDSETQALLHAYDMETGERVYGLDDQIHAYLDPALKDGRLVGTPTPFRSLALVQETFWQAPEVQKAQRLVFSGIPTIGPEGSHARFPVDGRYYVMSLRVDSGSPRKLLVVVNPETRQPIEAFDTETGRLVYAQSESIGLHLDPEILEGRLVGDPDPYLLIRQIRPMFLWKDPKVREARTVVFSNVPMHRAHKTKSGRSVGAFSFGNKSYLTHRFFDRRKPVHLLVVVDAQRKLPTAAFDMATGEQLYPRTDWIRLYLDPKVEGGKLVGDPQLFKMVPVVRPKLWRFSKIKKASTVALQNVPTFGMDGIATFSFFGRPYRTTRRFDEREPLRLLVLLNRNSMPTAAYDLATGEKVYGIDDLISVYRDPVIEDGRLVGEPVPFRALGYAKSSFWKSAEVRKAARIAMANVQVFRVDKVYGFSLAARRYPTSRPFDLKQPLRLLVVVDPGSRPIVPLAAYDMETGEQVYAEFQQPERKIRAYLNASIRDGRLEGNTRFFWEGTRVGQGFWKIEKVQKAQTIVLDNIKTHSSGDGRVAFSIRGKRYVTSRLYQPGGELILLVSLDPKGEGVPIAYDMATGEQVFPVPKQPADSRLGVLADLADDELAQAGAEEPVARTVRQWTAEGGMNTVVLSASLLNQPYVEGLKTALMNLPPELAKRVYLAGNWEGLKEANRHLNVIPNGSADDMAVAVGQQMPAPERVWLVGEFAPVYGWMLKQMGLDPEKISSGADIQEFLAQMGILLGVPEAQVQSGMEELHRAEEAVEAEA